MGTKLRQLQYESDCWKRSLAFITSENSYSKTRLADVVKNSNGDSDFLEQAEHYQNYYIQQEALLSLLRNDVYTFDKLLQKNQFMNGVPVSEISFCRKRLREELGKVEGEFARARKKFNNFLDAYT